MATRPLPTEHHDLHEQIKLLIRTEHQPVSYTHLTLPTSDLV